MSDSGSKFPEDDKDGATLKREAVNGAFWSVAQNIVLQATNFVSFIVLARVLEVEHFGLAALVAVYVSIVQVVADQGFIEAIVQKSTLTSVDKSTAFWINIGSGATIALLTIVLAPLIALVMNAPDLAPLLSVASLSIIIRGLSSVQTGLLRREMRFKAIAVQTTVARIIASVICIVLALHGAGAWSLVWQQIITMAILSGGLWYQSDWRPSCEFSAGSASVLWRFGGKVLGFNLVNLVGQRVDRIVIGVMLGPVAVGVYNFAAELIAKITDVLIGSISGVALPLFSRLNGSPAQRTETFLKVITTSGMLTVPLYLGLSSVAWCLLPALFGDKWQDAIVIVQILSISGLVYAVMGYHGPILNAVGHPEANLYAALIQGTLNLVLLLIFARWGLQAAAIAMVARVFLTTPLQLYLLSRFAAIPAGTYIRRYAPIIFSGIVMMGGLWLLRFQVSDWNPLGVLMVYPVVGALLYFMMITILGGRPVNDLIAFLRLRNR